MNDRIIGKQRNIEIYQKIELERDKKNFYVYLKYEYNNIINMMILDNVDNFTIIKNNIIIETLMQNVYFN